MAGTLRTPQGQIQAGSGPFPFKDFSVKQSRTRDGDRFSATSALSAVDLNYWMTTPPPIPVTVTMNGTQLFIGNVDHCDVDFESSTFAISGRDNGAAMIDAQTSEKFLNQTPIQIVQAIAARHGIPVVSDPLPDDAGKMFSTDSDSISNRGSEWSFINALAEQYGMIAYITNGTLFFKNHDETLPTFQINYGAPSAQGFSTGNFIRLKASRNLILGRKTTVNVRSHHHRSGKVLTGTAQSSEGGDQALVYNHTVSGITSSQASTIAAARLAEVKAHEFTIDSLELPGNEAINARTGIVISGTGTPVDATYDSNNVEHKFSLSGGYVTTVNVKNKKKGS